METEKQLFDFTYNIIITLNVLHIYYISLLYWFTLWYIDKGLFIPWVNVVNMTQAVISQMEISFKSMNKFSTKACLQNRLKLQTKKISI